MVTVRQRRLNELLSEELTLIVPGRLDDPDLEGVRITRAEVTRDMSSAKVYYVAPAEVSDAVAHAALERAQGQLRRQLASLGLRRVPRLSFARDRAFEGGERVLEILAGLSGAAEGDGPPAAAPPGVDSPGDEGAADDSGRG